MGFCYILCPYNRELKGVGSCKGDVQSAFCPFWKPDNATLLIICRVA